MAPPGNGANNGTPDSRPPLAARKFCYFGRFLKGNRNGLNSKTPKFSCLRRKMIILYYGYQVCRRRERNFWIYVLYSCENRAVGARKFWNFWSSNQCRNSPKIAKNLVQIWRASIPPLNSRDFEPKGGGILGLTTLMVAPNGIDVCYLMLSYQLRVNHPSAKGSSKVFKCLGSLPEMIVPPKNHLKLLIRRTWVRVRLGIHKALSMLLSNLFRRSIDAISSNSERNGTRTASRIMMQHETICGTPNDFWT